jgi:hypothetical protein
MSGLVADVMMKQRREDIRARRSAVMKRYWQDKAEQKYQAYEQHLQNQVDKYRNRYQAYKTNLKNLSNPLPAQHAMLEQHRANYEEAKGIRDAEMKRVRSGGEIDMRFRVVELFNLLKRKENDDVGLD